MPHRRGLATRILHFGRTLFLAAGSKVKMTLNIKVYMADLKTGGVGSGGTENWCPLTPTSITVLYPMVWHGVQNIITLWYSTVDMV